MPWYLFVLESTAKDQNHVGFYNAVSGSICAKILADIQDIDKAASWQLLRVTTSHLNFFQSDSMIATSHYQVKMCEFLREIVMNLPK